MHAVLDNYAAHKHPNVLTWLADDPRWTLHFAPTSCSWLNAVEGFFSKLTRQSLKRGVSRSVEDLEAAIARYGAAINWNPKPFVWTATTKAIRTKLALNRPVCVSAIELPVWLSFKSDVVVASIVRPVDAGQSVRSPPRRH